MSIEFHHGDNRVVLRQLIADGVRVQSVVCDPPYGLTSVTKRFGKEGAAPALPGTDGAFQRASGGFMGQQWDASGIERDPEFWRLIYEILLPGGHCLAFSSPRTGHWMAVAMEQAGFVMHPFLGWCYGSGFPKASNAARAIDTALCTLPGRHYERTVPADQRDGDHVCPATPEGEALEGWAYGAQSMKPALEPIYVAQRPFDQKNGGLNILTHGVGAVNIDGCRVPTTGESFHVPQSDPSKRTGTVGSDLGISNAAADAFQAAQRASIAKTQSLGRHPANLLHDGSTEVRQMFPVTSSVGHAPKFDGGKGNLFKEAAGTGGLGVREGMEERHFRESDTSAARFFNAFPLDADSLFYCAKASKADRAGSKHPTVKPIALMRWCCRLVTPPGGTVLDPFAGSGTTGAAALAEGFNCTLIEAHGDYAADIRRRFGLSQPFDIDALIGGPADHIKELIG